MNQTMAWVHKDGRWQKMVVVPEPTWRNLWRRQTGAFGFLVEWIMWLTAITAALKVLTWMLEGVAWMLRTVNG